MTQVQGAVSDVTGSINISYVVPFLCFAVIAFYATVVYQREMTPQEG